MKKNIKDLSIDELQKIIVNLMIVGEIKLDNDEKIKFSKKANMPKAKIDLVEKLTDIWADEYKQGGLHGHDQYKYLGRYYCGNNVWAGMVDLDWKFGFGGWKFCVAFFEPRLIEPKNVSLVLQKKHINYIAVDEQCNDGYWLYVVLQNGEVKKAIKKLGLDDEPLSATNENEKIQADVIEDNKTAGANIEDDKKKVKNEIRKIVEAVTGYDT